MGHSGAQKCECTCLDTFFELSLYQEYTDFKGLFFGHMIFWSARIREALARFYKVSKLLIG